MDFSKDIDSGKKKEDAAGTSPPAPPPEFRGNTQETGSAQKVKQDPKGEGRGPKQLTLPIGNKKEAYPSKTHINLALSDSKRVATSTEIILFLLLVVLIGAFAKFAVIDPLASGMESSQQVNELQTQLNHLKASNAENAGLAEEYSKYIVKNLTPEEQATANRNEIIDLLQTRVMNFGYLSSLKTAGNVVTVTCADVSLNDVSALVESLESDYRVAYVTVSTAQSTENKGTSATISINMKTADQIAEKKEKGV